MIAIISLLSLLLTVSKSSKYQVTKPSRFTIGQGNFANVFLSSPSILFRWGAGCFVNNYEVSLENVKIDEDDDQTKPYRVLAFKAFRRRFGVEEKSSLLRTRRPEKMLELYEFEGCPFCKKVREAVTILDLDVLVYPTPKDGPTYRPKVKDMGGKIQFPYLVDSNTGVQMYESNDIVRYLFTTYGEVEETIPNQLSDNVGTILTAGLSLLPRLGAGSKYSKTSSEQGDKPQPLVLYGYEASPFVKLIRERLCELEIPYIMKTCARGSPTRNQVFEKTGTFQVPYLEDVNTGENLFESLDILNYIDEIYA